MTTSHTAAGIKKDVTEKVNHVADAVSKKAAETEAEGTWDQLMGKAKEIWGSLTDDDFTHAKGSVEKLIGRIKEKVGGTVEEVKKRLDLH